MTTLQKLITPPPQNKTNINHGLSIHLDSIYESLSALISVKNVSLVNNSDFSALGPSGMVPTTQLDGDNTEFMDNWFVMGSSEAKYTLSPTIYPNNSSIITQSDYFVNVNVSDYSGTNLYFYQRQPNVIRKLQQSYMTFGLYALNNGNKQIALSFKLIFYLDPSTLSYPSGKIWLQPGFNQLTATIQTDSLNGKTVGNGNYAEWQLNLNNLDSGSCNFDLCLYKAEYGKIHTSNVGSN